MSSTSDRIKVWHETRKKNKTIPPAEKSIKYDARTDLLSFDLESYEVPETSIRVIDDDCVNVTILAPTMNRKTKQRISDTHATLPTLLLNMSDNRIAGGLVYAGSGAQEENLFRRSNLETTLTDEFYPLMGPQLVYSPSVTFHRGPESGEYFHLHSIIPYPKLAVVSCPAIPHPLNDGVSFQNERDEELMKARIELMFKVACVQGHKSIVLSAHGCGAWNGPARRIAELYRDAIHKFKCFDFVVFAILNGHDSKGNYAIFKDVICGGQPSIYIRWRGDLQAVSCAVIKRVNK